MQDFVKLLGVKISSNFREEILEKIEKYIKQTINSKQQTAKKPQKPLVIFTPNPEIVMFAQKDSQFKEIVNKGQINIPDGQGVVWAANILGLGITKRMAGADLVNDLVILACRQNVTIGLIGGFNNLALEALECLKDRNPKLKGWAIDGPYIKYQKTNSKNQIDYGDWQAGEFVNKIRKADTKILFVAFGFPKQEYFITEIAPKLNDIVIMAVGGTFNYISGRIPRAPLWMQKLGLEWFYRLIKEPARIKRQLIWPEFVLKILQEKSRTQ